MDGRLWLDSDAPYTPTSQVPIFADVATRDAQWTSPTNGSLCVTLDTYTTWLRKNGVWQPPPGTVIAQGYVATDRGLQTANGLYDVANYQPSALPYPVQTSMTATWQWGFGTGACQSSVDIFRHVDAGASPQGTQTYYSVAAQWARTVANWSWTVPAGSQSGYKTRFNLVSSGGGNGCYVSGDTSYIVRAT